MKECDDRLWTFQRALNSGGGCAAVLLVRLPPPPEDRRLRRWLRAWLRALEERVRRRLCPAAGQNRDRCRALALPFSPWTCQVSGEVTRRSADCFALLLCIQVSAGGSVRVSYRSVVWNRLGDCPLSWRTLLPPDRAARRSLRRAARQSGRRVRDLCPGEGVLILPPRAGCAGKEGGVTPLTWPIP